MTLWRRRKELGRLKPHQREAIARQMMQVGSRVCSVVVGRKGEGLLGHLSLGSFVRERQ